MKSKINTANILTSCRILCSAALLFTTVFSPIFFALYLTAGITDVMDGIAARKQNTSSEFGAKLDTAADICFTAACMIKLLPVLNLPQWIWAWILCIAGIKLFSIVYGVATDKGLIAMHTLLNKITGLLLFALPLTIPLVDIGFSSALMCAAASLAAIQEGYCVSVEKIFQKNKGK